MVNDLRIEKAELNDALELSRMIKREFRYAGFSAKNIKERLGKEAVEIFKAVEENEQRLIGFIDWEVLDMMEKVARINAIAVKKDFRGRDYGKDLLEFGIRQLREERFRQILLLVEKENEVAKNLYQSFGFTYLEPYSQKIEGKEVDVLRLDFKPLKAV
jgi:ribosomal protein S18 acetylase RimI-like enzyme